MCEYYERLLHDGDSMRRPPGGATTGALSGHYASPGIGLGLSAGAVEYDDFSATHASNRQGSLLWAIASVSGQATASQSASSAATEYGITALTPGGSNKGGTLYRDSSGPMYTPGSGMLWCVKIAVGSSGSNLELWSGWTTSESGRVRTADSTGLVGIRYDSAGAGTWEGVVKDGAGSGNETSTNLGALSVGSYLHAGWEAQTSDNTLVIQFFTLDTSNRMGLIRTDVGSAVSANIPTGLIPTALGCYRSGGSGFAMIDLWQFTGRAAR